MENEISILEENSIRSKIHVIRGQQVMLDFDLAEIYGYETRRFNEQVKNNSERFDEDFRFQLTKEEFENLNLMSKFSTSSWGGTRKLPYAFTEQGIYFQGPIFDAYAKFETFITQATKEIILIDNYVDLSVLQRLAKKKQSVNVTIYTAPKTKLTAQDVQTFNAQYPTLTLNFTSKAHDRFLIIDQTKMYHIGASLKDLGKKHFAFSVIDSAYIPMILGNL